MRVVTVAAIIGGFVAVTEMRTQISLNGLQLEIMNRQFNEFKIAVSDRYTANDALRDFAPVHDRLRDHEDRLRLIERRNNQPSPQQ